MNSAAPKAHKHAQLSCTARAARLVRPVAARLLRSNRPPEADAVLLPGSNRLGRRAAQPPSRGGSCLRSRGIRPPELQEPLARLAGAVAVAAAIRAFVVPEISWVRAADALHDSRWRYSRIGWG